MEMEGVVRGIQADMTKLSKSHSHTSNTVSKLLDKSRKLSVTMKEVKTGVIQYDYCFTCQVDSNSGFNDSPCYCRFVIRWSAKVSR